MKEMLGRKTADYNISMSVWRINAYSTYTSTWKPTVLIWPHRALLMPSHFFFYCHWIKSFWHGIWPLTLSRLSLGGHQDINSLTCQYVMYLLFGRNRQQKWLVEMGIVWTLNMTWLEFIELNFCYNLSKLSK